MELVIATSECTLTVVRIPSDTVLRTIVFLLVTLVVAIAASLRSGFELRPEQVDALWVVTPVFVGITLVAFLAGELSKNYSQVDKLWSVVPAIYAALFCWQSDWNPRLLLMTLVISVWAARLTGNFARRGGFSWPPWAGEEDYRWEVLRKHPLFAGRPWRFRLFHAAFICGYQMSLIYLFTLPTLFAWTETPLGAVDYVLAVAVIGLVVIEFVADQQQYDFQTEKYRQIDEHGEATGLHALGFVCTGLWRYSRHPNYAAEQAVWIVVYGFSVAATGAWLNPSIIGPILLLILFVGSADFSEGLSAEKYPRYKRYVEMTPRFWPQPWRRAFDPEKD